MGGALSEDNKLWNEGVGCCSSLPPSFHMHDDTISLHLAGFLGFFSFFFFFLFSQKLYFEDNQKENVFWVWLHVIYPIAKVGGRRRGKTERLLLKGVEAEGCRMKTSGTCILFCVLTLFLSPADWFPWMVNGQELESATGGVTPDSSSVQSDSETTTASSDCREEKFPCTRLYSVHKPVKQCISYLCVTSVRRMYVINKEVCTRIVCKENEVMQDEICRQLAGLPPRRLRRSGQPLPLPCRQLLEQQRRPDAL
ncbi:microfibrillar-associated protein 5 isoform X2 [Onychostruthus taczanowskii]|uniref:microfibrillar-associated protein 5 isoform X2 n=1 Tax=Onychostruthus taczanowskii TaxID=356909 RepID=UPI001B80179C|nr:microfibrillar-associated protein 5 isoform X2 [Onychostruthus taczanowskii]